MWTFCTYERQGVLMATRRAERDNKEALTMSAMCSVEWRRTRARSPSSLSFKKTRKRARVSTSTVRTSNGHRPRTSYEEAARSRTVFCRGCNWACLVELPFKWITRRRARHEPSLRNRSTFFGNRRRLRINRSKRRVFFPVYIPCHFFLPSFISLGKNSRLSRMLSGTKNAFVIMIHSSSLIKYSLKNHIFREEE